MTLSASSRGAATALVALAVAFLLLGPRTALAAQLPQDDDLERVIREREDALTDAANARDRARLEALLAPDFVLRGAPDLDRQAWIHNALTLCWGNRSRIDQFTARAAGDTMVAGFEMTFYSDPVTCRPAVLRSLITDVWTRHGDEWRLTLRHTAAVPTNGTVMTQYTLVPEQPPTWDLSSELSLVATGGNTTTRTIGAGGTLLHNADQRRTRLNVNYITSETDDVTRARALTAQARHGFDVRGRINLFGEALYARDLFAGIRDRRTASGGAAFSTPMPRGQTLRLESSVGYTEERRLDEDLRFATASAAVDYAWTVRPGTTLTEAAAFIADLERGRNWRSTSITTLSVTLTRLLSLKATQAVDYRHTPVPGFRRTDLRTAVALVVSVQRRPGEP